MHSAKIRKMNSDCRVNLKSHVYWVSSRTVICCWVSLVLYLLSGYSIWKTTFYVLTPLTTKLMQIIIYLKTVPSVCTYNDFKKHIFGRRNIHKDTHTHTAICQLLCKCELLSFPLCSVVSEVIRVCVQQIQWWWEHELNLTVCALQDRQFIIANFGSWRWTFLMMTVVVATEIRWNVVWVYKNFLKSLYVQNVGTILR
jgi:hypothetical protein